MFAEKLASVWTGGVEGRKGPWPTKKDRKERSDRSGERCWAGMFSQLPTPLWILRFKGLLFFLALGVLASSTRFPSWNSWDLLLCSAVKPGIRWMSFREEGGGVPGGFSLFFLLMGGVPGGVTVVTIFGVRGGVRTTCRCRGDGGRERWPDSRGGGGGHKFG